jgi:Zn-dependent M28 family amino/carboxypeptidase
MGAASTMELVRYFAEHRTKRDIIFNLNNAEEDFLWGAKAYYHLPKNQSNFRFANHPWAREVIGFVNLEGAGAGYPPVPSSNSNL